MQLLQAIAKHLQYILFQCNILLQETVLGQIYQHFLKKKDFVGSVFLVYSPTTSMNLPIIFQCMFCYRYNFLFTNISYKMKSLQKKVE